MKLLTIAAAVALAFGTAQAQQRQDTAQEGKPTASSPAPAPDRSTKADRGNKGGERQARKAEEDRIEADAKAAKAKCDGMDGKQKDLCQQEAKAKEKVAKAELDAKYNPTERNKRKVEEAKAEGNYEVAKAKCEAQTKDDDACKKQAKAEYDRAKADIKAKFAKADTPKRERTAGTGATGSDNTPNRDLNRSGK